LQQTETAAMEQLVEEQFLRDWPIRSNGKSQSFRLGNRR